MRAYALTHVRDEVLLRDLAALVVRDRATTAELLAHIAEVDARRLYLPAAYTSMHAYCVGELHLSEDAAYKRIQAARAARRFPVLFEAVADGRLHLAALCLLAPHLTPENLKALLAGATHRRKSEIETWLAQRVPSGQGPEPGLWTFSSGLPLAPGPVPRPDPAGAGRWLGATTSRSAPQPDLPHGAPASSSPSPHGSLPNSPLESPYGPPDTVGSLAPGQVAGLTQAQVVGLAPAQVAGPSPGSITLRLSIAGPTQAKLQYARELLSHSVPSGSLSEVFDRALDALIVKLEKRKFAASGRPLPRARARSRDARNLRPRALPAHVRRAVWERDRGQCTFTSRTGRRCGSRRRLEFDHVVPVARGGRATVEGLRLRCRAHNQYEAERVFGATFMRGKREGARRSIPGAQPDDPPGATHAGTQPTLPTRDGSRRRGQKPR